MAAIKNYGANRPVASADVVDKFFWDADTDQIWRCVAKDGGSGLTYEWINTGVKATDDRRKVGGRLRDLDDQTVSP